MSDIVNEIPETLKPIARTVWENVAHLMGDYSEVPFDQVLVRPRYQGVRGTLRHLAQRLDELTILASDHQDLVNVVAELGIEDSATTPAEAVRELKAEVDRLRIQVETTGTKWQEAMDKWEEALSEIERLRIQVERTTWQRIKTVPVPTDTMFVWARPKNGGWSIGLAYRNVSGGWSDAYGAQTEGATHWAHLSEPPPFTSDERT